MKTCLVLGSSGFIGTNLVNYLKSEGHWVRGVDIVEGKPGGTKPDDFIQGDLRNPFFVHKIMLGPTQNDTWPIRLDSFDEVYQLAADMGGAGYVFTGNNDAEIMHNSAMINLNVAEAATKRLVKKLFFSSSACVYNSDKQYNKNPAFKEVDAYPANPSHGYGWEKIFAEQLYLSYARNHSLDIRIARFHNIFGPYSTIGGDREKFPAAICRKVIEAKEGGEIELWGTGYQTRSYLYIDECLEGVSRLMKSSFNLPLNIGSSELVSVIELAEMVRGIANKDIRFITAKGPVGPVGRNSDNSLASRILGWVPTEPLRVGIEKMFNWVKENIKIDVTV